MQMLHALQLLSLVSDILLSVPGPLWVGWPANASTQRVFNLIDVYTILLSNATLSPHFCLNLHPWSSTTLHTSVAQEILC